MQPFPEASQIALPPRLAAELLAAAERLPAYENHAFYSFALQAELRERVRAEVPEGFDWLTGEIRSRLAREPYAALVRGLLCDEGNRLFVALNRDFGDLVARPYEKPRAQLVHYIQPAQDIPAAGGGRESERLHTDSADWPEPVALVSMVCVRPDRHGGGRSRLLEIGALREEAEAALGADALEILGRPVPWRLAPYQGGGVAWSPVLTRSTLRWRRYTIDAALTDPGVSLDAETTGALDAFGTIVDGTERTFDFLLETGDFLIIDNRRTVHGRTEIGGDPVSCERLMIRSWIRPPAAS